MDPFVAEIRIFPFNFPPKGWAFCDGQLLTISQNTALFSLVGTFYGGDGKTTFALPNLQGNTMMHTGQGPGLSQRFLGEMGGEESVTLLTSEMPAHRHTLQGAITLATVSTPAANLAMAKSSGGNAYKQTPFTPTAQMSPQALAVQGGSLPHNNLMPYLTLNHCIALQGVYPPRT